MVSDLLGESQNFTGFIRQIKQPSLTIALKVLEVK